MQKIARLSIRIIPAVLLLSGCPDDVETGQATGIIAVDQGQAPADAASDAVVPAPDAGPVEPDAPPQEDAGESTDAGAGDVSSEDAPVVAPDTGPPPPFCAGRADGTPCDDGNPCTTGEVCSGGTCFPGEPYGCADGLGCTLDLCDGEGGCSNPIKGNRCLIKGVCYEDGAPSPHAPCLSCVVPVSQVHWTADDGLSCDDGDFCTTGDHCFGGECAPGGAKACDDGNFCTDDGCEPEKGCTHAPNERPCSDGDPCTVGDACQNAKCLPGKTLVTCDDQNTCTDDLCVPSVGCVHQAKPYKCNDGDPCTLDDKCVSGKCTPGSQMLCKDDNPCTDDKCHPKAGCVHPFNSAVCSDGDPCTAGDICAFGSCQAGPLLTLCNDGNPCTKDFCNPKTGGCTSQPDSTGKCTDTNPCTIGDFCEGGICKPGGKPVHCDDANPCTDDTCGEDGTCKFTPNLVLCDDGDPCSLGDACKEGLCVPGTKELICKDSNPCTDDFCEPGEGCKYVANAGPCSDGNACTLGDTCTNGQCVPGSGNAACDDANPCTDDFCLGEKGCVNAPNDALCDDGEACTTSDKCKNGICTGALGSCDDGNECTKEVCLAGGGCQHIPLSTPECRPKITITSPPRGAMIKGPGPVQVTGTVKVGGAGLLDFYVNEAKVPVDSKTGAFTYSMKPEQGLNLIRTVANGKDGGGAKGIRSFAYSTLWHPTGAKIPEGLGLWLSQKVWDDDNTSDIDDIATVMTLLLESFDLASLIPNPLTTAKALQCTFTVKTKNVTIGKPQVDIVTKNQALGLKVTYPNLSLDLAADGSGFLCPSVSGKVKAKAIVVQMDLVVKNDGGGLKITMANAKADIQGLDVTIDGILGFLVNWIIDFFEGTIADEVEKMVIAQLDIVPEMLAEALEALAITETFDLPAFIGDAPPTKLTLSSTLSNADFDQFGGFLELDASFTADPKKTPYTPLGSVGRDNCLAGGVEVFDYLMQAEIEIALRDDLLNQLFYAAWWAGAFEIPLPASMLGDVDLSEYGVTVNDLKMSFLLPPILTSCNAGEELYLGLGDMKVSASLLLFGKPMEITAYASGVVAAELLVAEDAGGATLGIALDDIVELDVEVEEVKAGFENAEAAVEELIGQFLTPDLLTGLGGESLSGFPIPEIPLDGFTSAVPKGTTLSLDLKKVYRLGGRTVLAGNAK